MKSGGWIAGLGRVISASGRAALGIAILAGLVSWSRLAEGAWLPWTLQIVLVGIAFFLALGIAWPLGALGGILGWSIARRRGRAERGPAAGVAGLWAGLVIGLGLTVWALYQGFRPLPVALLCFILPVLGPWVTVRWLAEPLIRKWAAAQSGLLSLSHFLGARLILRRGLRLDARGLALGLLAGLVVSGAALAGVFQYPEAVLLAQGVRLRNEPIMTPSGPIELSRWIGLYAPGATFTSAEGRIVILKIDNRTEGQMIRRSSEPAVNALVLRKLAAWHSGPVILPLSLTALTSPATGSRQRPARPRSGAQRRQGRPPAARLPLAAPGRRDAHRAGPAPELRPGAAVLNQLGPPLDRAAFARGIRDVPLLAQALRSHPQAFVCLLPVPPFPRLVAEWLRHSLGDTAPVPRLIPLPLFAPLFAAGRPVGSAQFAPFGVAQVPSLRLTDAQGVWALPLLLATGADPHLVSPPPSPRLTGSLTIRGRKLRLAAPGQFLVDVYGSQPGAIFPHVSYSAVLNEEPLYDRSLGRWVPARQFFHDRIVFLDTLNQPSYDTPVGTFQATELLAMATDNLLTMDVLAPPSPRLQLLLLIWCGALAGHVAIGRSPLMGATRIALLAVFYWLGAAVLFIWPGVWLPVVSVTAAMGLAYLLVIQFVFAADEMELARQRQQQERFEQEVAIGRAIQTSLLPPGHLTAGAFEIASRSVPAREVGGDFYNLFSLPETNPPRDTAATPPARPPDQPAIGIVLGDVSGKGVQGAMYMTVTTTLLEARAARDAAPEAVLAGANTHLYPKLHGLRMFVTVFYGILDVAAGRLEFASAGQVPPVLASPARSPGYAACRGTPLGALRESCYQRQSLLLAPGDTLILASDGFVEARSPAGRVLGYDGFLQMVSRHLTEDPSTCLDAVFSDVQQFSGDGEEQDDRTLVVIRHHATPAS